MYLKNMKLSFQKIYWIIYIIQLTDFSSFHPEYNMLKLMLPQRAVLNLNIKLKKKVFKIQNRVMVDFSINVEL